jgi:hypothetical protein
MLGQAGTPSVVNSRADLREIVRVIDSVHPWPWRRISADSFHHTATRLARSMPSVAPDRIATDMMRLVAMLQDGHTSLFPSGQQAFTWWFPIRFHQFSDSLAITATDSAHADLLAGRVLRIGGEDAAVAAARVAALSGADNTWGGRELTGLLSNVGALKPLGLTDGRTLNVEIVDVDGSRRSVRLQPEHTEWGDPAWMQRGEMFGPPKIPVVTAFDHLAPLQYRQSRPSLPLHLRNRIPIWFTWLAEDSTIYVQSNFVQDFNGTRFAAVADSIFAMADQRPVRRLIVDLRYNSGGDGSKLPPFVHEIIRRPRLDQPGHVVLLVGQKTFSAAVLWLSWMREHTSVVTVGEPAGAARNHSGDATDIVLPHTQMILQVSTLRHYGTRSDDTAHAELPDFPVRMSAADYFAGRDPVLEFARAASDLRSLPQIALTSGLAAARTEAGHRATQFGSFTGWRLFDEREMNSAGYAALAAGGRNDAIQIFEWNTRQFPQSGNVWDSYGEVRLANGDTALAVASYRRAAELDPGNQSARAIVAGLGKPKER